VNADPEISQLMNREEASTVKRYVKREGGEPGQHDPGERGGKRGDPAAEGAKGALSRNASNFSGPEPRTRAVR
jgi:hypothetical protein